MVEGLYQDGKAEGRARVSLADGRCFIGVMRNNRFDTSDPINRPCE
jgi:hypothetical protein